MAEFDLDAIRAGVIAGERAWIARAITLVESTNPDHRELATELLTTLGSQAKPSRRVGITGVPGAGKSTFIDALGVHLIEQGLKVAVLAVDPSSTRTGGSILGDKTRMSRLAASDDAYIRPSPSGGTLGGVARATREAMTVVEAAGFDVVLIETVGVGQSEITVAEMVDTFLMLTVARTGDQLQGIKRGILELVDLVAVNKADGDHLGPARETARELRGALRVLRPEADGWTPKVLMCSSLECTGIDEVWQTIVEHQESLATSGAFERRRAEQRVEWLSRMLQEQLISRFYDDPTNRARLEELSVQVANGTLDPSEAVGRLVS
ncbi:MAG: methylmalonyl Co-A mutase-associated GTPase MeaB [Candidatus Nanopelagicales bacterium]